MTFILVPLSLLAIFLLVGVFYNIASIADPVNYDPYTQEPLSPVAEFYLSEWTVSRPEDRTRAYPQQPAVQQSSKPFRLQLYWDSDSMSEVSEDRHIDSSQNNEAPGIPRVMKRFSIQLPLASSTSLEGSNFESEPQQCTSPEEEADKPDSGTFLVALAAQERRVLELREELHKAESDLTKLKRQWAHHEASRKKQEIRQEQPMRPIKSPTKSVSMMQEERSRGNLAARRAAAPRTRQTQRKVFEGGRHTRALSLLSPTSIANRGSIATEKPEVVRGPMTAIPISSVVHAKQQSLDLPREDIVTTGKQIMDDLKEGLWTFIEDLKQATVGEEAMSPSRIRHGGSLIGTENKTTDLISGQDLTTVNHAPNQNAVSAPVQLSDTVASPISAIETKAARYSAVSKAAFDDDEEAWDSWDSPPSKNGSSNDSPTTRSTPRSSVSSDSKERNGSRDQIPWPALQKLTPGNLTRTASSLMKEWERSLSSPVDAVPESQQPT